MRIQLIPILLLYCGFNFLYAEDKNATDKISNYKFLPLVSSSPNSGTGVGGALSYVYKIDDGSSPSQLMVGAQYTTTESKAIFAFNNAFLLEDKLQSKTGIASAINKSQFSIEMGEFSSAGLWGMDLPFAVEDDVRFDVEIFAAGQQLLYELSDNLFVGGHLFYLTQTYSNLNDTAKMFFRTYGLDDTSLGAFGIDFAYDTRSLTEKYYPKKATLIGLSLNANPSGWGNEVTYYSASLNLRRYTPGLKEDDVWANQFYGKYVTANTPDNGLPTIGRSMIIRGFPVGKYKARYLNAFQTEYRYKFTGSKYKAVAFAGIANLSGGSKGTLYGSRDDNNGNYYSGGIGLRYTIQPQADIDLRVDIVTNSDNEQSVYVGVNQSF